MKANELRIGNLCQDKISGAQLKVTGINENDISFYVVDRNLFPLQPGWQAEPIPLTEEWLEKFGFTKVTYTVSLSDGGMPYHYELEGQGNHWRLYFDGRFFAFNERKLNLHLSHNRYVHQLQNLYFALVGEELKLKEDESKTE